jgi:hypothetical protein
MIAEITRFRTTKVSAVEADVSMYTRHVGGRNSAAALVATLAAVI